MAFKPGQGGRPKGAKNLVTLDIRQLVTRALERKGGVKYLERLADEEPRAFASLLAKLLPSGEVPFSGVIELRWKGE